MKLKQNTYIFLSHSHEDIENVRRIRNYLESKNYDPIMLYLHGITKEKTIKKIIESEIDARNYFIFCDSDNAKKSKWVRYEREYAKKVGKKLYREIDINQDFSVIKQQLDNFIKNITVVISYTNQDVEPYRETIKQIKEQIVNQSQLHFFSDEDLVVGEDWKERIKEALKEAKEFGATILLITENYFNSDYCTNEANSVFNQDNKDFLGVVVPVIVGNPKIPTNIKQQLKNRQYKAIRISKHPTKKDIQKISEEVLKKLEFFFSSSKILTK